MVKRIAIIATALVLIGVAGAGIGLRWVLGTTQGFFWVLETVSRLTSSNQRRTDRRLSGV